MKRSRSIVLGLTAASIIALAVAGGARLYAADADSANAPMETVTEQVSGGATPAQDNAMSEHGLAAINNIHLARIAVNDGYVDHAKQLLQEAQALLGKMRTEDQPVTVTTEVKVGDKPEQKHSVTERPDLIPIVGDIQVVESVVASVDQAPATTGKDATTAAPTAPTAPDAKATAAKATARATAIKEAQAHLQKGDRKAAVETLKAVNLDLVTRMVSMPLKATTAEVDHALKLIDKGKLHEANLALLRAQQNLVVDASVVVGPILPVTSGAPAKGGPSPNAPG